MSSDGRGRRLLVAAIAGIALYVALDALVQALPPHYSALGQAESDLAVGPYGYIMAINFVNRGLLSLLFLLGFSGSVRPSAGHRLGYCLVGVWAVGSAVLAVFPTDVGGSPTLHGAVHLVVALIAFVGGVSGELVLSRAMRGDQSLGGVRRYAEAVSLLALLSLGMLLLGPAVAPKAFQSVYGLVERLFIGLVLGWMLVVSAPLLKPGQALGRGQGTRSPP